jgi:uncharacterized membrane protein affecting hemolysin expression
MSNTFTNLINSLTSSGLSTAVANGVASVFAKNNSVQSKSTALLNQLVADSAIPDAVVTVIQQIEAIPGVPSAVIAALEGLKAPGVTQLQIMQAVPAIEAAIAAANPSIF